MTEVSIEWIDAYLKPSWLRRQGELKQARREGNSRDVLPSRREAGIPPIGPSMREGPQERAASLTENPPEHS